MTTEQNKLADKIEQVPVGPFAILLELNDGTHFKDVVAARGLIVAALRAAGELEACAQCGANLSIGRCWEIDEGVYFCNVCLPDEPAPSASVREALERAHGALLVAEIGLQGVICPSDRETHANDIRECELSLGSVREVQPIIAAALAALSSTSSPLMAAGEATPKASDESAMEGKRDAIVQLIHKHIEVRQRVNVDLTGVGDAADAILRSLNEPQSSRIDAAARASETVEATSPAKRDYAARVMREAEAQMGALQEMKAAEDADIDFLIDNLQCGKAADRDVIRLFRKQIIQAAAAYAVQAMGDEVKADDTFTAIDQDIGWLKIYAGSMTAANWKDMQGAIENQIDGLVKEIATVQRSFVQAMAEPTQETGKAAEVVHPWYGPCDALAPDGACAECMKASGAEPTREEIAKTIGVALYGESAFMSQNLDGWSLSDLLPAADAIIALKPRGDQTREGGPLTADFTKSLPGGKLDDSTFSEIEDALDAINAPMTDGKRYMTLVERIAAIGFQPDPPTTALEPDKQE